MWSLLFCKSVLLLIVLNVWGRTFTLADDDGKQEDDIMRGTRDHTGMWFGPRLGKRSLRVPNEGDRQTVLRMLEAADAMKYYYDQLRYGGQAEEPPRETKVSKKIIFTPKLGRALDDDLFEVDFTPRLGRRRLSDETIPPSDRDTYPGQETEPSPVEQRSQYFSPRLGRGSMTFSPRLGRNLVYDLYPGNSIRVTRSTNKTKST